MVYTSNSPEETKKIARNLAEKFKDKGAIIALTGELGAGKTAFTQGFAKGLGIGEKIISPTFILIREHKIPSSKRFFYHIDLYRLDQIDDIRNLGIEEILNNKDNVTVIEWAERISEFLPSDTVKINISKENNIRVITIH